MFPEILIEVCYIILDNSFFVFHCTEVPYAVSQLEYVM